MTVGIHIAEMIAVIQADYAAKVTREKARQNLFNEKVVLCQYNRLKPEDIPPEDSPEEELLLNEKKVVRCDRLEELTGKSVGVQLSICGQCRCFETVDLTENMELASCVINTAFSRYFPENPVAEAGAPPELVGEREQTVDALKAIVGDEKATQFVDMMFEKGLFKDPEEAADFLEARGLVAIG